jgi:signal transduction histidine kinase
VTLSVLLGGTRVPARGDVVQSVGEDSSRTDMTSREGRPPRTLSADEFASLVTHELRNPLNALSGWLHLLSADTAPRSDGSRRALDGARRALEQQIAQVDMLGRVLRLSMPDGEPAAGAPIDLRDLLDDCVVALRDPARAVGRDVALEAADAAFTPRILGDRAALSGALQALGRYALRHGMPAAPLHIVLSGGPGGAPVVGLHIDEGDGAGRSIWSVFAADGGTRLALDLLQAALEVESHGARIGPRGDGRVGDALEIRFPIHDGSAATRIEGGPRA